MMRPGRLCLLLIGIAVAATSPGSNPPPAALATPLLVTYGHDNRPREGDPDFHQVLYVSLPAAMRDPVLVRIFDPDTDGEHDLAFGQYGDSATRFAIFGGPGAFRPEATRMSEPVTEGAGRLLAERVYGAEPEIDGTWQTLAELDPADGDPVAGRRYFRLLVDGFQGDDANVFTVAVGTPGNPERAPRGAELVGFRTTFRIPEPGVVLEIPVQVPEDRGRLTMDSFDAHGATVELALPLRPLPVPASGDNEWLAGEVGLGDAEREGEVAIVIGGGQEWPNDVDLRVTDADGRPVAMTLPPRMWPAKNARPSPVVVVTPNDCHTVTLDAGGSSDADGEALSFRWRFADGGEATGEQVTRRYAEPGTYPARLEVRDSSGQVGHGAVHAFDIEIKAPPVASATAASLVAPGEPVQFDGSGSSVEGWTIRRHLWKFPDGTELSGESVRHAFAEPGRYAVTLTVEDDSGHPCDMAEDELTVVVNAPPTAMAGKDRSAAIGESLTFDGRGSEDRDGRLTSRRWAFGDGTTVRGAVVEHAFTAPGRYPVRLEVTDDSQVANAMASDEVTVVVNDPPIAVVEAPQYVAGGLVRFDGAGSSDEDGTVARYAWDFGDGSTGSGPTPSHVYDEPGTYEVTLMVADDSGTIRNAATQRRRVVVNAAPLADAGADVVTAPGEEVVLRGDRSVDPDGEIAAYQWDLGDGTTASGAVAAHTYEAPGTYFARLSVRDDSGHDEAVDFDHAKIVVNRQPRAEAGPDVVAAPGKVVRLDGGRSFDPDGELTAFRWDVDDAGKPLAGRVVEHRFSAPGIYTAQLTVSDDSGTSNGTARDDVTIRINHRPTAVAGADVTTAQRTLVFDGSASADADGDPLDLRWDFGDGQTAYGARVSHTYAAGGTFPVVLTVTDRTALANSQHRDALTVQIDRPPIAAAGKSREACTGDVVVFDGGGSRDPEGGVLRYAWDFGDGSASDIVNPTKVYEESGSYAVTLSVEDTSGLPGSHHADRIYVRIHQSPVADAGDDLRACANAPVAFDGSRSADRDGVVNRFEWDFGDGAAGGGARTTHVYSRPGRYRAILTIEGDQVARCDNTATDEVMVDIVAAPNPAIEVVNATPVSAPTRFDGSASTLDDGDIIGWLWDFGDGTQAEGAVVEHRYARPGVYRVGLTVEGETGDPDCRTVSTHRLITVNAAPIAVAGEDRTVSAGEETLFDGSASADPDGGLTRYHWVFGDGTTADGLQVRHAYRQAGRYEATLTVTDDTAVANSTATDALEVEVMAATRPQIEGPAVACAGEPVRWQAAATTAGGATSYDWLLGDGTEMEGAAVTHRYALPGRYAVTLFRDDGGELAVSGRGSRRILHINAPPRATAGRDRQACPGVPVRFDAAGSRDSDGEIVARRWDFGDGVTTNGHAVEHTYEEPGVYPVTLTVRDDSATACDTATDELEVAVQAPPVADAGGDREVWIGGANDALILDGSGSRAAEGRTLAYTWTLPDGEVLRGLTVKHVLQAAGELDVTLRVDDLSGRPCAVDTDTIHVVARRREP